MLAATQDRGRRPDGADGRTPRPRGAGLLRVLRDITPGILTAIVTLASTLSYVAFVFSPAPASAFHYAVAFGLISAGAMAIIFALASKVPFAIAGPDSKTTAVLAAVTILVVDSVGSTLPPAVTGLVVLATLVAGTFLTGLALYLLGAFRLGQWVRLVPYPVVGGFMAASGWLLAAGGIGVLVKSHLSLETMGNLFDLHHAPQIATGLAFAVGSAFASRLRSPFVFPLYLIAAILFVHAVLALMGISVEAARASGWLLDFGSNARFINPITLASSLQALDLGTVGRLSGELIALFAVTATTLLLGLVVIEVEGRLDVDLDRELRLNGIANALVGLSGGMVGTISVNRTLFNFQGGGRGRTSGLVSGAICLLMLWFGTGALSYFPVPILGGLLVHQGVSMLHEWLVRGRRTMLLADYLQVIVIMVAIVTWDFIAGVVIGIVAACVTFAINTSRVRLIRQGLNRSSYPSRVDRPVAHQEELVRSGNSIQIMWLHGFVFFGSAHRLLLDVKQIVENCGSGVCRSLILDFRDVLGIDSSAILNLNKLWNFAEREGFVIVLSSLSAPMEKVFRMGGLIRDGDPAVKRFPDLDAALEWCEDDLIAERVSGETMLHSAEEWLASEIGGPDLVARLVSYLELLEFDTGSYIFRQGSKADALYFLYSGRVTILFETPESTELRLRSMVGRTVLGEMGIYRTQARAASVRADRTCVAYKLSADAMGRMESEDPTLAYAMHKYIVRVLASRLEFANREIAGLQS